MNINDLNTKLVSELRQIAKSIGISDVEKLRKQELINQIAANDKQGSADKGTTPLLQTEKPVLQAEAPASEIE